VRSESARDHVFFVKKLGIHHMPKKGSKTDGNYAKKSKKGKRSYSKKSFSKSYLYSAKEPVIERKNLDLTPQTYNVPLTSSFGSLVHLTPIPQGTGDQERIGRNVRIKSVQVRVNMIAPSTSANAPSQIRYMVVYDRQSNGTSPTPNDVLGDGSAAQFLDYMNLSNQERFIILIDKTTDSVQSSALGISDSAYVKCDLDMVWEGPGSNRSDVRTGAVYLMIANNSDIVVGKATEVDFCTRVRYTDA